MEKISAFDEMKTERAYNDDNNDNSSKKEDRMIG